jgi:hypothetical protein
MRRTFIYDGKTYEVDGARSEWVLRFWDDGGVDIGSVRNRAGGRIDELTDEELCRHLARASREPAPSLFSSR